MNIILTHYHIRCDTYIGINICAIRITPCDFIYFINDIDLIWDKYLVPRDHPIYYSVTKCKYYAILGQHNDCIIMDLIYIGKYEEEYESCHKTFLNGFVNETYQTIQVG